MKFWGWLLLVAMSTGARGQALLKIQGSSFAPIQQKTLDAHVTIDGPVATTELKMSFFNPAHAQVEADFLYTLPEGAVVTKFAYWYKHERVVGRIVEKERAAQIYQAVKNYRRDPALVELIGKRTFRARIFPVEQRSALRVEMTIVSAAKDGAFTVPLKVDKGEPMDQGRVEVAGRPGPNVTQVFNNYGVASTFDDGRYHLVVEGKKWRPDKDLRIGYKVPGPGLHVQSYGARSSELTGYFTLLLSCDKALSHPRVSVSGLQASNVHAERPKSLAPGQTILVTGQYRGRGKLHVGLNSERAEAYLTDQAAKDNPATKLWASDEIDTLGKAPRNEKRVTSLSFTYMLPSPYTSWLAMPDAERKRFAFEIKAANAVVYATKVAKGLERGESYSRLKRQIDDHLRGEDKEVVQRAESVLAGEAYRILQSKSEAIANVWAGRLKQGAYPGPTESREKAKVDALAKSYEYNGGYDFRPVNGAVNDGIGALRDSMHKGTAVEAEVRKESRRLHQWWSLVEVSTYWTGVVQQAFRDDLNDLEQSVLANTQVTASDKAKQKFLLTACAWMDSDPGWVTGGWPYNAERVARDYANLALDGQEASADAQHKKAQLENFEHFFPAYKAEEEIHRATAYVANFRSAQHLRELGNAVRLHGGDSPEAKPLLEEAERYNEIAEKKQPIGEQEWTAWYYPAGDLVSEARQKLLGGASVDDVRRDIEAQTERVKQADFTVLLKYVDQTLKNQISGETYGIAGEEWRPNPDEAAMATHERALRLFGELLHVDVEAMIKQAHAHDPNDSRMQFIDALHESPPDAAKVSEWREKFRDDNPEWRGDEWINWRIERIETDVMLDKLEKEQRTPELERQIANLQAKYNELRARMGDPKVQVRLLQGTVKASARFPWGAAISLTLNRANGLWEARFDVPLSAREGTQDVQIVAVDAAGKATSSTWQFVVDLTAPTLRAVCSWRPGTMHIAATTSPDTARVKVVPPWGGPVELQPTGEGQFAIDLPVPEGWNGGDFSLVGYDKAHNRASIVLHVFPRS